MPMGGGLTLPEDTRVRPRMEMSPGTPGWQPLAPPPPVAQRKAAAAPTKTPGTLSSMIAEHLQSGGMGKKSKVPSPTTFYHPTCLAGGRR